MIILKNNNFKIKKSIENIQEIFKEQVAYDLSCEFDKILRLQDVSFQAIKHKFKNYNSYNTLRDLGGLTKTEILLIVLEEEPFIILNEILPYIREHQVFKDIKSINSMDDCRKYEFLIYDDLKINEFSIITHIDEPTIIDEKESWVKDVINFNIKYCDLFDKTVYLEGKFIRENNISSWDVEEAGLRLCCNVKGIMKEDNIPTFIEYLLEACINVKYKNYKMAFFNSFASFDNFIEMLYEKTFDFYIKNYSKYRDELKIYIIDELEEKELGDYEGIYNEIFITVDLYLKKKIRYFANQNRRLIDEKLYSVLKEIDIHKNDKYNKFNKIVSELKDIEVKRNSIAHGEKIELEESIGEVLYKILTVMFSIVYEQDFSSNEWNEILYDEECY